MSKDPAMLFYAKDWIEGTAEMTIEERGVYITLLAHQHQKDKLPNDDIRLARLAGCDIRTFRNIWKFLKEKFIVDGGYIYNSKLNDVKKERKIVSVRNTISGTFASVLRLGGYNKKQYSILKSEFIVDIWMDLPKELLKERLTEWCTERLENGRESIEDANADANADKDKKEKVSEFVTLSKDEIEKIKVKYGVNNYDKIVETLDNYKGAHGKKYKSDYRAILNWVGEEIAGDVQSYGNDTLTDIKRMKENGS